MAMHWTREALERLEWGPQPPSVSSSVSTHHFARQPPLNLAIQEIGISLLWPAFARGDVPAKLIILQQEDWKLRRNTQQRAFLSPQFIIPRRKGCPSPSPIID